ncbi:tyrosine phosphatase family-domain-containing protein [Absidia repens]|uniref:Tyrosine phosphatase family-domain-containing protein n=1 Tax=Absidia repens TaxID=90262 RepID=A0A1X2J0Y2_9FUNG|nr:tyrosine phosphatase family-domain-containing protein [Absidia repens]
MNLHSGIIVPRWIDVQGVKNFRDLGGWPTKDGSGYVRERTIFRCAHLGDITPEGIKVLQGLNVKAVFDFRSDPELERYGKLPDEAGIPVINSSMYESHDFNPKNLAATLKNFCSGPAGIAQSYLETLEVGKKSFGNIFHHIIKEFGQDSRNSLIVHCTAGKDRTGLWCMLLLGLCGVDNEVIAREYALTNVGYWLTDEELAFRADYAQLSVDQVKMSCSAP